MRYSLTCQNLWLLNYIEHKKKANMTNMTHSGCLKFKQNMLHQKVIPFFWPFWTQLDNWPALSTSLRALHHKDMMLPTSGRATKQREKYKSKVVPAHQPRKNQETGDQLVQLKHKPQGEQPFFKKQTSRSNPKFFLFTFQNYRTFGHGQSLHQIQ